MCLSLYDYQSKARRYSNGLKGSKIRIATKQKHTIDSQKTKKNSSKIKKKTIKPQKEKQKEKESNKEKINWRKRSKVAINTYLSIVTLNVNGLNAPIKRQRVADWRGKKRKTRAYNMLPTRGPLEGKGHI